MTSDSETAKEHKYLDVEKISSEAQYDGLYAVCTDLLDDDVNGILKVSEGRWQIEKRFRIIKTDFSARPVYLQHENRIKAHFLICFLALLFYRIIEKKLDHRYTCDEILHTLKYMNFAEIEDQGFMPLYRREKITDALHDACGFRTDHQFITKSSFITISSIFLTSKLVYCNIIITRGINTFFLQSFDSKYFPLSVRRHIKARRQNISRHL